MLVACCSSTYYLALPISLNSLDREGARLLSPRDSPFTSKTRCRDRWYRSRRCTWAQVGVRWRLSSLLCVFPRWSIVVPSWGDQGPCRMLGLIFYFGTIVGPWVYWMIVMLFMYLCDMASVSQLCTFSPFIYLHGLLWRLPYLRHCFQCGYASKSCFDT